jgi:DNA-binding IscR family transcriptional regulator
MTKNQSKIGMTYRKLPITAKIAVINSRKRMGDVTKVAERTGFSPNFVSEVLNGLYRNDRIVNKAFDMTRGRKTNMSLIG